MRIPLSTISSYLPSCYTMPSIKEDTKIRYSKKKDIVTKVILGKEYVIDLLI